MSSHGREENNVARDRRVPRRAFLSATGAVTAAALGGVLGSGRASAATGTPLARQAAGYVPLGTTRGVVGATVQTAVYPSATDRYSAARIFDRIVNRPGAVAIQKWFFAEGKWPSSVPSDMAELSAAGCKFIMCFKPSRDQVNAKEPTPDQRKLRATCNMLGGLNVIYDCSASASASDQQSYFPGSGLVDKVYCDFYGFTYKARLSQGIQDPLYYIEQVADDNGLPFGLGEWGFGSASDHLTPTTNPTARQFVDYINTVFTRRLQAGKVNDAVLYYEGAKSDANKITGPEDWKTPLFQEIYDSL